MLKYLAYIPIFKNEVTYIQNMQHTALPAEKKAGNSPIIPIIYLQSYEEETPNIHVILL